nr:hypothetical protein [Candidatus Calescibacterium sp.]
VAIFAMVGCRPAETPGTGATPTITPTPADKACPKLQSIVAKNVYGDVYRINYGEDGIGRFFTLTLTFDENIEGKWSCLLDEDNWTITVSNPTRQETRFEKVPVIRVKKITDKKIEILAAVFEGAEEEEEEDGQGYYGLICDEEDAKAYADEFGLDDEPSVADTIKIELDKDCIIYDQLGNACCGLEAEACCSVTCEVTVPTGCPL